jgi:hypothetical protein
MISNHIFRYTLLIDSFKLDQAMAPTTIESEQSAPSISVLRAIRELLRMRVPVTLCPHKTTGDTQNPRSERLEYYPYCRVPGHESQYPLSKDEKA